MTNVNNIPQSTIESLGRYVNNRIETGGFLRAVLSNDLAGACAKADINNRQVLPDIVEYIYNNLPYNCWGSPEAVQYWLNPLTDNP